MIYCICEIENGDCVFGVLLSVGKCMMNVYGDFKENDDNYSRAAA